MDLSFVLKSFCAQVIEQEHLTLPVRIEFLDAIGRNTFFEMNATRKDNDGNYRFSAEPTLMNLPPSFTIRFTCEGRVPIEKDFPPVP